MNNSTSDTHLAAYHRWSRILAILLAVLLALLWLMGFGPNRANCCGATAQSLAPAPAPAPVPAPAPAPAPVPVPAPTTATPAVAAEPVATPAAPAGARLGCDKLLSAKVGFETGSSQLTEAGKQALDGMLACLAKGANVVGHTDNVGGDASNQMLSVNRANTVAKYLSSMGVSNITASGKGESAPIANNASEQGRALNRRMDITPK